MKSSTMIRKLLATMLVLGVSVSAFTGCGGSKATDDAAAAGSTDTADASSSTDTASDGAVNINITRACFNLATPDDTQVKKVEDAINDYIKDKINVHVTLTDIGSGEYTEKANLALANNEINLLWTASWESVIGTNDLVAQNAAYDITDLFKDSDL